jgi:antitoxin component of RelBE/YafQ-DinJ toxin-antitoxin module
MTTEDELKLKQVSDAFNAMPFEYRKITANSETMTRIRDLQRLKERIKDNYMREMEWINERIKSYLQSIKL